VVERYDIHWTNINRFGLQCGLRSRFIKGGFHLRINSGWRVLNGFFEALNSDMIPSSWVQLLLCHTQLLRPHAGPVSICVT
jgi:hypothetical protein